MPNNAKLKRRAKGERPYFFDDPAVDKLLAMLMGLAGEVSVMRDRIDTIERVATEKKLFSVQDIEAYEASDDVLKERAERREIFLGEITRIISAELEGLEEENSNYDKAVELVEEKDR